MTTSTTLHRRSVESAEEHRKRVAELKIGSTAGIHSRTLIAQEINELGPKARARARRGS